MDPPVTFGGWLVQRRKDLGLTRQVFAERVGCSVSALRKIEDGERRPSVQIADLMANGLNIPPEQRPTFVRVARGELSIDRLLPHVDTPAAIPPRTNLPVFATPLIGRARQVEQLGALLRDPRCRLLTLVGPGGIGKTRLAIDAASQVQDAFDGVFFVALASVNAARLVVPLIADAIGFAFHGPGPADPKSQLFAYLKGRQTLFVIDNLEQLLTDPGIEILGELLVNAPRVKLLVTSRESLGFQEEWVFQVEGLVVPKVVHAVHAETNAQDTSAELFLQRARRVDVGFRATAEDYAAIVHICQLVEGNPLGIELAAAWVRTLTCVEIVQEIERGLDFLSGSARDLPARHRSMRAVFDHSWRLVTEEEQSVLLRLSVFHGGFRREAAEAVAGATLSVLSALVTKSIVRRGGGRYDLHELIHQYAAGHLAANPDEQSATRARHASYFLRYFSQADGRMRSPAQKEALAELTAEMDNIRAAWHWAVTHREFGLIEETLRAFAMLFETRGWYQEGLDMLGRAIDALEAAQGPSPVDRTGRLTLGHLLTNRALITFRLGQHAEAQAMLERSLEILRPVGDARFLVEPITYLGAVMSLTGNYARALDLLADAREKALGVGDRIFAATSLSLHANVSRLMGQPGDQHGRLRAAVAEWRAVGDPRFIAYGLNFLGQSALALGRYEEARAALEESVELLTSVGARWNLGHAFQGLGAVAHAQGDHQRAADMFLRAVDTFTELGGRFYMGQSLAQMGQSLFALGNDLEAERVWRESLHIAVEIRGLPVALEALVGLATLRAKRGDTPAALEWLLVVLSHPASNQETKDRAQEERRQLEARLTPQQIQAAQDRARKLSIEQAFNQVLERT